MDPFDADDLRLLPDSPAIDAIRPMDLGAIGALDAAGVPVPQGYAPDIGAYEYSTAPTPPPTTLATVEPTEPPVHTDAPNHGPAASGQSPGAASPGGRATPAPSATPTPTAAPTRTPRVTPTPEPRPSGVTDVPPPTGGPGALDQLILLVGVVGMIGLIAAVFLAGRSPT